MAGLFGRFRRRDEGRLPDVGLTDADRLAMLRDVRRRAARAVTERQRIELELGQLDGQRRRLRAAADASLTAGRDDLARDDVFRAVALDDQARALVAQRAELLAEEERLVRGAATLEAGAAGATTALLTGAVADLPAPSRNPLDIEDPVVGRRVDEELARRRAGHARGGR